MWEYVAGKKVNKCLKPAGNITKECHPGIENINLTLHVYVLYMYSVRAQ